MEVVFLGTNGWYDTDTGNTICILVKSEDYDVILDAGNGIYKADRYITGDKPVYLLISHFHLDHIEGLHILNKFHFRQGLRIYGQKGTREVLKTIVNEPYTSPIDELPFSVEIHELPEGHYKVPFPLECRYLLHASPCLGYRMELEGKILAYCPDTGICENAVNLARDADLLMAECSLRPGERNPHWPHLNPEDAAEIARQANAKRLVLVHFDANRYRTIQERLEAVRTISGLENCKAALDDMVLKL
jgi:ribonuclease BN (tRNA processing enzyme)